MSNGFYKVPIPVNEPIYNYAKGSTERNELQNELAGLRGKEVELSSVVGGKAIETGNLFTIHPPHDIHHTLGTFHSGDAKTVELAIQKAMAVKGSWENMPWEARASVFLKAADLISGPYRARINAATMLGQSKNAYQAEIDSACELADFFRFNVAYMSDVYHNQPPISPKNTWNRTEWRPLEGFVFALTPFNFTAIAGNLPTTPAMLGNTVVWKPSNAQIYSAAIIMDILQLAGLPDGVINLVYVSGPTAGEVIFSHPDFGGIHFTGSTEVFQTIWQTIGGNIKKYKSYPRIVGETGGKDFVFAHESANPTEVAVALARGAFEYQGQKCSAASRAYIPESLWPEVKERLVADVSSFKMGPTEDFSNFINAVIDQKAYEKLSGAIDKINASNEAEIIVGGGYSMEHGYFIQPTVAVATNPKFFSMEEELFGPVLTIFVYKNNQLEETLDVLDSTSMYALTGAIFAKDRMVINELTVRLRNAAGNFYINDKPTGAVVGQQPFGGARGSGTNDKAGSMLNLLRWVSPRSIKENFVPPINYEYPFLK